MFSDSAQFGGIACNNTALNGVRARYCSEGDNIATSEECAAATLRDSQNSNINLCINNPFDNSNLPDTDSRRTHCERLLGADGFAAATANRINYCFQGGNGSNGTTCQRAIAVESCILDPFMVPNNDKDCSAYASQRQQRVDYCTDDADPDNLPSRSVCKVEDTLDAICNDTGDYADAFAHYCRFFEARDDYESKRKNVALLCLGDSPPTTCARIADCLADPYIDSFLCNDEALTLAELKPKRVEACKSATDPGVICAEQALVEVCNTTPFAWHCHRQTSLIILQRG